MPKMAITNEKILLSNVKFIILKSQFFKFNKSKFTAFATLSSAIIRTATIHLLWMHKRQSGSVLPLGTE